MSNLRRFFLGFTLLTCFLQAHGVDKYTDENRPYEFGFNIEGEQHRHEKKDENGIIMGEFGFITADGVYHVTVYATDENGNFKILSTKNIRVKPYPTTSERQGHSLNPPEPQKPVAAAPPPAQPALEPPGKSCSHCSIPKPQPPPQPADVTIVSNNQANYPQQNQGQNFGAPQNQQSGFGNQGFGNQGGFENQPGFGNQGGFGNQQNGFGAQPGTFGGQPGFDNPSNYPQNEVQAPQNSLGGAGQRNPKQFEPAKPTLISAQMQIVDKNTDIYSKKPGEVDGLPAGLTNKDMTLLLYTFNYTVGFHGHHEEGYTNGAKKGYYFITGRDGIRTRVDYEADENGFRPKISQEVLDVLSDEVPKPETEKEERFGLKGYEFKWIYFPTDSKRQ